MLEADESTPLIRGSQTTDNDTNNGQPQHMAHHHSHTLPDIPEDQVARSFEQDDDLDRLLQSSDPPSKRPMQSNFSSILPELDADLPERPQPHTRRRTLSLDVVMEDVVEIFQSMTEIVTETVEEVKEEVVEIIQEEVLPVKPREEGDHSHKLSAIALAVLVFYKVSGGPFGCEPAVRAAGPFYALMGFAVFPIVWCLQEALVTAELGSAYPEPSGAVAWIEEAFGPKAGLLCGYFHWVAGATDNAIYPCLFLDYLLAYLVPAGSGTDAAWNTPTIRFFINMIIATVLSLINYTGLEIVGNLSIAVCIVSMSPFVLLCILGASKVDTNRWLVMPEDPNPLAASLDSVDSILPSITYAGILWRPFINNLFWNLNSFDVGASFAGEVQDPDRVFPKAMFMSVALVCLCYLLPLMVSLGTIDAPSDEWKAGFLTTVAGDVVGPWLAAWMVLAAGISNIALYEAEMSGDAYQLMGMADRGLVPRLFGRRSRFGTPTYGIITGTIAIFALGMADFDALVEMLNFAYSLSLLMEFAAFIKLRITDDDGECNYMNDACRVLCVVLYCVKENGVLDASAQCCLLYATLTLCVPIYLTLFDLSYSPPTIPHSLWYSRLCNLCLSRLLHMLVCHVDCLQVDLHVFCRTGNLWHVLSRLAKDSQALQLVGIRGGTPKQKEAQGSRGCCHW
jgi:amino acid transporter